MRANCSCCGYLGTVRAVRIGSRSEFVCERCECWLEDIFAASALGISYGWTFILDEA